MEKELLKDFANWLDANKMIQFKEEPLNNIDSVTAWYIDHLLPIWNEHRALAAHTIEETMDNK
jgi:hypothetical protein